MVTRLGMGRMVEMVVVVGCRMDHRAAMLKKINLSLKNESLYRLFHSLEMRDLDDSGLPYGE